MKCGALEPWCCVGGGACAFLVRVGVSFICCPGENKGGSHIQHHDSRDNKYHVHDSKENQDFYCPSNTLKLHFFYFVRKIEILSIKQYSRPSVLFFKGKSMLLLV